MMSSSSSGAARLRCVVIVGGGVGVFGGSSLGFVDGPGTGKGLGRISGGDDMG